MIFLWFRTPPATPTPRKSGAGGSCHRRTSKRFFVLFLFIFMESKQNGCTLHATTGHDAPLWDIRRSRNPFLFLKDSGK